MEAFSTASQLFDIPFYIEFSGYKGYHLHIFLSDYIPVEKAHRLAHSLFGSDIIENLDKDIGCILIGFLFFFEGQDLKEDINDIKYEGGVNLSLNLFP